MRYLDKYPGCMGCPVSNYCGTMISSIRLCHSYSEPSIEEIDAYAKEQIAMSLEIM